MCSQLHSLDRGTLPAVLLAISSTINVDTGVSATVFADGTTLRLPGEFLHTTSPELSPSLNSDLKNFVHSLRKHVKEGL